MKTLPVSQIFHSIQGEGSFIGVPSVFIRLFACNLSCSFCDDPYHKSERTDMDFEAILEAISPYETRHIIITGGEPTLYDLNDFICFLQEQGYFVAIESNGLNFNHIKSADWITYSPKDWNHIHESGFDELKFVVRKGSPVEKIVAIQSDKPLYLQPENYQDTPNHDNVHFCLELLDKNPRFRLSPQLHKYLGVA